MKKNLFHTESPSDYLWLKIIIVAALYFLSAKAVSPLSLVESGSVFAIWPPTGIAFSALLLFGSRIWPGIFLGALTLNYTLTPLAPSVQIAITNTLGPLTGYYLLRHVADPFIFKRLRTMMLFVVMIIVASITTASGGVFALWLHGLVLSPNLFVIWTGWFLGDLIGFLLITPFVLAIRFYSALQIKTEMFLVTAALLLANGVLFGPLTPFDPVSFPVEYFLLPPLIWAALRFGPLGATAALLATALFTILGTIEGFGPFQRQDPNDSLFLLQSFNGLIALTILVMVAIMEEKKKAFDCITLLNRDLQKRVKTEVEHRMKQEELLIQQSKMASMGEMIGAISHQLKQPLNVISLSAEQISDIIEFENKDTKQLLGIENSILSQVDHMSETITNFRNFFKPSLQESVFKACDLADEVYSLLKTKMKHMNVTLVIHENECFEIKGLPNELKQVLLNIYGNACDILAERHIEEKKIEVRFKKNAANGTIYIRDNGGGIPEELLPERVFEPYVSTKGDKGTGIGLQICKTIIEHKFQGKIWAHNIANGAEFVIELPFRPREKEHLPS